ncbi:MAG: hypothetical protein DRJ42_13725 [Deltaproteobacteria bacterium]|nr:MAG: hypothetical protein DRJ42_13725 [Deltaproteobacteria bacterium]
MRLGAMLMLVAAFGCGDDGVPHDSGVDGATPDAEADAEVDSGPRVSPVTAPALPSWPCPEGWRQVSAEDLAPGLTRCEPWPEVETPCARHEVRMPGDEACRSVGASCPADGWPADLPATGVIYVRPGATAPPDGTAAAPFPTPEAALADLPSGTTTLALSVGEYPDSFHVYDSLTIRGACPEGTILSGPLSPIIVTNVPRIIVEDVTFVSDRSAQLTFQRVSIELRRVAFEGVVASFYGPELLMEDVVMRAREVNDGFALTAISEAITMERILIEDCGAGGIFIVGDGTRALTDIYVRRVDGAGLSLFDSATLERVAIDGAADIGLAAFGNGQMTDVLVRGVTPLAGASGGFVLQGDWNIEGAHISRAGSAALALGGGDVALRDAIIEGTPASDGTRGRGIVVTDGGGLDAERLLIHGVRDLGVLADRSTSLALVDTTIQRVDESLTGGFGRCVHVQLGAQATLDRVLLEDCTEAGVMTSPGSLATLRDVHLRGIRPTGCPGTDPDCTGAAGIGLLALENAAIDGERIIIEGAALAAVIIVEDSAMDLRDGTVRGNPIGINIQAPGYDLSRVMNRMVFTDNGLNLDATALPLPDATATIDSASP